MRTAFTILKLIAVFLLALAISLLNVSPVLAATPIFINEIHYENSGSDVLEAVEIAGPAGTDLSGWSLVLYNGVNQLTYNTIALGGTIPDQCGGYGTLSFATTSIQNGAPDGLALVDDLSNVVQFLSYEGSFTAGNGPASGMASTDIGVLESAATPVDQSLQLGGTGNMYEDFSWNPPAPRSAGNCNPGQTFTGGGGAALKATKIDALLDDVDGDGEADPGDTIGYTIVITNIGAMDAAGVAFTDTIDGNTTLVDLTGSDFRTTPLARSDGYAATGNIQISVPAGSGLLANDVDLDGTGGVTVTAFDLLSANGGNVSVAADGSFTYDPPPGFTGVDTFTYAIQDIDSNTAQATVSITVNDMVWFIDNGHGGANDGRLTNPFQSIAAFNASALPGPGQAIFIHTGSGNYTTGIDLQDNQLLFGQGFNLSAELTPGIPGPITGITLAPFSSPIPGSGPRPNLVLAGGDNGVDMAQNNRVQEINIGDTPNGFGLSGTVAGSPVILGVSVTGIGGALNVAASGTFGTNVNFDELNSANAVAEGINLVGVSGTLGVIAAPAGINNPAGAAIRLDGGTVDLAYPGDVTKGSAGSTVLVSGGHSGTFTLTGGATLNTTAGDGLRFDNADGTYNFDGTVILNGGDAGIDILNGAGGIFTFANATITDPLGIAFNLVASAPTSVIYTGQMTKNNAGRLVDIDQHSGGPVTFNGGPLTQNGTSGTGIRLIHATGNVIFNSPIDLGMPNRLENDAVTIDGNSTGTFIFADVDIRTNGVGIATGRAFVSAPNFGFTPNVNVTTGTVDTTGNLGPDEYAIEVLNSNANLVFSSVTVNTTGGGNNGGGINLNTNTGSFNISGLDLDTRNGSGILASTTGTVNVTAGGSDTINTTGRAALDIDNSTMGLNFTTLDSTGSNSEGINLDNVGGSLAVTGLTTIDNAGNEGIELANSTAAFTFADVDVLNRNATGLLISNVTGPSATFGNVDIPNPNSATGYGLRVENSSANLLFASTDISDTSQGTAQTDVDANAIPENEGDGDAIFLTNNSGSFTVNGGLIQNVADHAIDSRGVSGNISLANLTIQDIGVGSGNPATVHPDGFYGLDFSGAFLLQNSSISRFETASDSRGLNFLNVGTDFTEIRVDNSDIANTGTFIGGDDGFLFTGRGAVNGSIVITNGTTFTGLSGEGVQANVGQSGGSGTTNLDIVNSLFQNAVDPNGFGGISLGMLGTATLNVNIGGNTLSNLHNVDALGFGNIHIAAFGLGFLNANIDGNDLSGNGTAAGRRGMMLVTGDLAGETLQQFDVVINDNDINGTAHEAIYIDVRGDALTTAGPANVRISNNRIGDDGVGGGSPVALSGREAIEIRLRDLTFGGAKTLNLLIDNNFVRNADNSSADETVDIDAEEDAGGPNTINATVIDNTFTSSGSADNEFEMDAEDPGSVVCLDLRNNTASVAPGSGNGSFELDNGGGAFNANISGNSGTVSTIGTIGATASCTLPTVMTPAKAPQYVRSTPVHHPASLSASHPSTPPVHHSPFTIHHSPFTISHPQSAIRNRTSAIERPQSAIQNRQPGLASPLPIPRASGETISIPVGDLNPAQQLVITFQATVDDPLAPPGTTQVCNQADIGFNPGPPIVTDDPGLPAPNDPTCTGTPQANLILTKSDSADPVPPNTPYSYAITVTNNGPSTAQNVVVTDTLPGGVIFNSTSGCAEDPTGAPTCALGAITGSSSVSYTILVTAPGSEGLITNTASLTTTTHEPTPGDNNVLEETVIQTPATITITKDASPADGTDFPFIGDLGSFSLDDAVPTDGDSVTETVVFANQVAGTYTITETPPLLWAVNNVECMTDDPSDTSVIHPEGVTIDLDSGENFECLFSNGPAPGAIVIQKVTDPAGTAGTFDFTDDITAPNSFSLDHGQMQSFNSVDVGSYTVTESDPGGVGYDLTGLTCDDGGSATPSSGDVPSRAATINVDAGEIVTCVFTNTARPGRVAIEKRTEPAGAPEGFGFITNIITPTFSFNLTHGFLLFFPTVAVGSYTATETLPSIPPGGFDLTGLTCDDNNSSVDLASQTATINVDPDEFVTCIFTNTRRGSITIIKDSQPVSSTNFAFSGDLGSFSLDDAVPDDGDAITTTRVFSDLTASRAYTVTESLPGDGYSLSSIDCDDGSSATPSTGNTGSRTATINLDGGEAVSCIFNNSASQPYYLPLILKNFSPPPLLPDLAISDLSTTPIPGGYTVVVTATNQGTAPVAASNNFHVTVYLNGDFSTPVIAWGAQGEWFGLGQSRVFSQTYAGPTGTLNAWVDPFNVVVESDDSNNISSGLVVSGGEVGPSPESRPELPPPAEALPTPTDVR